MALFDFEVEEFAMLMIIIIAVMSFGSGSWATGDNALIWAPALLAAIPFKIFAGIYGAFPLLAPIAFLALIAYWQFASQTLGKGAWTFIVLMVLVVASGV